MLGVGIVGAGAIAQVHAEALAAVHDVRVVAVASRGAVVDPLPSAFSGAARCPDLESLLDREDVDVVAVCSPPAQHAYQIALAVERGRHVVVEKPPASDVETLALLIDRASKRRVLLSVVSQQRLLPHPQHVLRTVASGALGRPLLGGIRLHWHRPQSYYDSRTWRSSDPLGGSLANQGWHAVDLLSLFLGPASSVTACAATLAHDIAVEDTLVATVRFDSGALGSIVTSTATAPGDPSTLDLFFEHGTITISDSTITRWIAPDGVPGPPAETGMAGSGAGDPTAIGSIGHQLYWEDVVDAIRSDREPAVTARSSLQTLGLVIAAYDAAESGTAVAPVRPPPAEGRLP